MRGRPAFASLHSARVVVPLPASPLSASCFSRNQWEQPINIGGFLGVKELGSEVVKTIVFGFILEAGGRRQEYRQ